jgi:hypothetical protein
MAHANRRAACTKNRSDSGNGGEGLDNGGMEIQQPVGVVDENRRDIEKFYV